MYEVHLGTFHDKGDGRPDKFVEAARRDFSNQACSDVLASQPDAKMTKCDGFPAAGTIGIGPYSVLIFSQDKPD